MGYYSQNNVNGSAAPARSSKKTGVILLISVLVAAVLAVGLYFGTANLRAYYRAVGLMDNGDYYEAIEIFEQLENYKDSPKRISAAWYGIAEDDMENGRYEEAIGIYTELGDYKDSQNQILEARYCIAQDMYAAGDYLTALDAFTEIEPYGESATWIADCNYQLGTIAYGESDYWDAIDYFTTANGFGDSDTMILASYYGLGMDARSEKDYGSAITYFTQAADYSDAGEMRNQSVYDYGCVLFYEENYTKAQTYFDQLGDSLTDYGLYHFATMDDAAAYFEQAYLNLADSLEFYLGEEPEALSTTNRLIYLENYIPMIMWEELSYDTSTKLFTLEPYYYPGTRIINAYRNQDFSGLTSEEMEVYEQAVSLVEQAKAETSNDLELEAWLHDWLCKNLTYYNPGFSPEDEEYLTAREFTCIGAINDGEVNCQGYTDAFYLLGSLAGFQVRYVFGTADSPHAWNAIKFGGQWYFMDVTYDDLDNESTMGDSAWLYAYMNFPYDPNDRDLHGAFLPNFATAEYSSLDYDRADDLCFTSLSDAAAYIVKTGYNGARYLYVEVSGKEISVDNVLAGVKQAASSKNYSANWWVYVINHGGNTYITVYWTNR